MVDDNRYLPLIEKVFFDRYVEGETEIPFARSALKSAVAELGIEPPANYGDVIYAFRFRRPMPDSIIETQPEGLEWVIKLAGRSRYNFKLVPINRIRPNEQLVTIKIPDATPEIVAAYALDDEQALLAKVRYNRLIDVFLGLTTNSIQNHLRTSVKGMGQIEIDEMYVGVDSRGRHFVIPVQAKSGTDQLSVVQTEQDIACCAQKFPDLICRSVSAQFMDDDQIALFELALEDDQIRVVDERHYRLVPSDQITGEDLRTYSERV